VATATPEEGKKALRELFSSLIKADKNLVGSLLADHVNTILDSEEEFDVVVRFLIS
jgi:hypothetical protein